MRLFILQHLKNLVNLLKIFMLKVFMGHLYQILEASSTGFIVMADDRMNAKYILIVDSMDKILERKDFSELKEKFQSIWKPETLYSSMDEVDVWWSDAGGQSSLMDFIGSIETYWVKTGQQMFPLPSGLVEFLNESSDIVSEHKRSKAKTWKAYSRQFDNDGDAGKVKEKVEKPEPQIQKVVHEHRHHFENSIQEKPIDMQFVADEAENKSPKPEVKLSENSIIFDDETATLKVGSLQPIRFPSHKKEHLILRHMFGCRINEAIDWELVYETISGHSQDKMDKNDIEKLKRSIRDGVSAINNRISETLNTESKLLTMQDNAVIRHF